MDAKLADDSMMGRKVVKSTAGCKEMQKGWNTMWSWGGLGYVHAKRLQNSYRRIDVYMRVKHVKRKSNCYLLLRQLKTTIGCATVTQGIWSDYVECLVLYWPWIKLLMLWKQFGELLDQMKCDDINKMSGSDSSDRMDEDMFSVGEYTTRSFCSWWRTVEN